MLHSRTGILSIARNVAWLFQKFALLLKLGSAGTDLICRARVPKTLARSYLVIYRVVIFGLSEGWAGPSMMSDWPAPASGMSVSASSSCGHQSFLAAS